MAPLARVALTAIDRRAWSIERLSREEPGDSRTNFDAARRSTRVCLTAINLSPCRCITSDAAFRLRRDHVYRQPSDEEVADSGSHRMFDDPQVLRHGCRLSRQATFLRNSPKYCTACELKHYSTARVNLKKDWPFGNWEYLRVNAEKNLVELTRRVCVFGNETEFLPLTVLNVFVYNENTWGRDTWQFSHKYVYYMYLSVWLLYYLNII